MGMMTPTGNPSNIKLYRRPGPNNLLGLRVPQKMADVKKVLCPGHVKPNWAVGVQTSLNDIWKFKIPAETNVKINVATI
jgi:hypothetical protein